MTIFFKGFLRTAVSQSGVEAGNRVKVRKDEDDVTRRPGSVRRNVNLTFFETLNSSKMSLREEDVASYERRMRKKCHQISREYSMTWKVLGENDDVMINWFTMLSLIPSLSIFLLTPVVSDPLGVIPSKWRFWFCEFMSVSLLFHDI